MQPAPLHYGLAVNAMRAQLHALRLQAAEGASADIGFARGRRFVALAEHIHELVTHHRRSVSLAVETAAMARRTATHLVQLSAALEEAVSSESVDEMQDELQDAAAAVAMMAAGGGGTAGPAMTPRQPQQRQPQAPAPAPSSRSPPVRAV